MAMRRKGPEGKGPKGPTEFAKGRIASLREDPPSRNFDVKSCGYCGDKKIKDKPEPPEMAPIDFHCDDGETGSGGRGSSCGSPYPALVGFLRSNGIEPQEVSVTINVSYSAGPKEIPEVKGPDLPSHPLKSTVSGVNLTGVSGTSVPGSPCKKSFKVPVR